MDSASIADVVEWDVAPEGFDHLVADLRAMRRAAGDPSYAEIARRITAARAARGVPEHEQRMARSTLYDSFRDGRRRMDSDAVMEIALALGLPERLRSRWTRRMQTARDAAGGAEVVAARQELPGPVSAFVGRRAELLEIERALTGPGEPARIWITGMAGAGKTQLALKAAELFAPKGMAGVIAHLRGHRAGIVPADPPAVQRAVLRSLGVEEAFTGDGTSRSRHLARLLQERNRFLLLDDARSFEQVRQVLGDETGGRVVVTSRALPIDAGPEWTLIALEGLSVEEVVELLTRRAGRTRAETSQITVREARRLTEVSSGLPLVISLVGGRLASRDGWTLADHVDLFHRRLGDGRVDDAIRTQLDLSYAHLPADAAQLLRSCADVPVRELDRDSMAALLGSGVEAAESAAVALVACNLAVLAPDGRISLHSLVRAYAQDRAEETDSPPWRRAAFERLARHQAERVWAAYHVLAHEQGEESRPTAFAFPRLAWSPQEAGGWLRSQLPSVLGMAHEAPQQGCRELLFRLSEGLSWWMDLTGRRVAALELHETAAEHAWIAGDAEALVLACLDAGQLYMHSGAPERALELAARARTLIDDASAMSDPGVLGVLASMEAVVHTRQGRVEEAIDLLTQAVALHEERGESDRGLAALTNLSNTLHFAGRFAEAATVLEKGLRYAEAEDKHIDRAYLLISRGELRLSMGEPADAARDARDALAAAEQLDIPYLVVYAQGLLADLLRREGDLAGAGELLATALEGARTMGNTESTIAELLLTQAQLVADRGERAQAVAALSEMESYLAEDGDHYLRGQNRRLRADLAQDPGEREEWLGRAGEEFTRAGAGHLAAELRTGGSAARE